MKTLKIEYDRRNFIRNSSLILGAGIGLSPLMNFSKTRLPVPANEQEGINIIGPKDGYSPMVGTLVSMLNWMRRVVLLSVRGLGVDDLDYLHDPHSNTIGALLLHLAATERYYQLNTFEDIRWGAWENSVDRKWAIPSRLGEQARNTIKGNPLNYYLDTLEEVRQNTLSELKNRDDNWLLTVDHNWSWGPTNNFCKWFHVCEHESNHNGQIKWLRKRIS